MDREEENLIQKLAEELGICLDQENRMHCTLRWPSRLVGVTLEGDQLMYALLLKRDLEYWKGVCREMRGGAA